MDALQQLNLAAPITDTYTMIESMIIQRIAAQIAGNPQGLINNSSEWRIQMLARMGKLSADTAKIIASQTKGIGYDIEAAINTSVQSVLKTHDLTMTDTLSGNIRSALTMYDRQAISGKYNQVNTVMQYKAKQTYLKAVDGTVSRFERIMQKELDNKQEHLDVLNKNAMAVTLGERSRTEAIRATIEEMSDKGIPAFIDASGREWSAEAYVNMDIRNTVKNAANATQFACIEELGQDIVLVSSHAGARPLCAPYQGKFYSMSGKSGTIRDAHGKEYHYEPWSSTSYGEPAGLLGINCGHSIRGVSDGMFINREKQYDEKENSEEYDKVVKQRALERDIRKQKTTRNALKAAGDTEGVKEYDQKIKASTAQLEAYCDKNGLTMRRDRTEVYGYSDSSWKKAHTDFVETLDKSGNSGIMESDLGKFKRRLRDDERVDTDYYQAIKTKFSHGSDSAKRAFTKFVPDDSVENSTFEGVAHFDRTTKKISMHFFYDMNNPRGAGVTWFHEHGHLIDNAAGNISNNDEYRDLLYSDYMNYMKAYGKSHGLKTFDKVQEAIGNELSDMRKHSAVADILNGISQGNIVGVAAHEPDYWRDDSVLCSESFAHMYEAQFDETRYKEMKKYFPNALKRFESLLGGAIK